MYDGRNFTPLNLTKVPAWKALAPGDPWTIIFPEIPTFELREGTRIAWQFADDAPISLLTIVRISGLAHECVYEGHHTHA